MKAIGLIVLCVGLLLLLYALTMSTTFGDVHNIGLLNTKQNFLIGAGFVSLIGVIVLVAGIFLSSNNKNNNSANTEKSNQLEEKEFNFIGYILIAICVLAVAVLHFSFTK